MDGEVERGDHLACLRVDRSGDRPQPRAPRRSRRCPPRGSCAAPPGNALESVSVFGPRGAKSIRATTTSRLPVWDEGEDCLPHRRAVGVAARPTWRLRSISRSASPEPSLGDRCRPRRSRRGSPDLPARPPRCPSSRRCGARTRGMVLYCSRWPRSRGRAPLGGAGSRLESGPAAR